MDCPFKHTAITEDEPSTPTNSTSIVATDRIKTTALVPPAELATPTAGAPKSTTVTLPPATNATAGDGKGEPSLMEHQTRKKSLDFEVKSLDEIMKEKRQKLQASPTPPRTPVAKVSTTASKSKVSSLTGLTKSIASLPPKVSTMVSKELIHAPMAATKRPSIPSGGVPMTMTMAESSTSPSRETPKTRPVIDRTVSAASKSTPSILDDDMIDEQFAEIERLINS